MAYVPSTGLREMAAEVLVETLAGEKYARGALLAAFLDDLRRMALDRAPPSTRALLTRAENTGLSDEEFDLLVEELRSVVRQDA